MFHDERSWLNFLASWNISAMFVTCVRKTREVEIVIQPARISAARLVLENEHTWA